MTRKFFVAPSAKFSGKRKGISVSADAFRIRGAPYLHCAKMNTLGDRAEDVFLVSGAVLDDSKAVLKLEQQLLAELQI